MARIPYFELSFEVQAAIEVKSSAEQGTSAHAGKEQQRSGQQHFLVLFLISSSRSSEKTRDTSHCRDGQYGSLSLCGNRD